MKNRIVQTLPRRIVKGKSEVKEAVITIQK